MTYTVKTGDTMYNIAQQFGVTLDALIAANPQISNPDMIVPGQVINIPTAEAPVVPPVTPPVIPPVPPAFPPEMPSIPECPEMPGDMTGGLPGLPGGEMPGFPGGGMMPGFPGGGMMPGFPGGGMMPGFPGGGMMPGFPGGGMMPGFPGGGMMPGFPGGGMMPGFPGGGMMPGFPGGGMMPGFPGGGMPGMSKKSVQVKLGDEGELVKLIQQRLTDMGYYKGSVNGRFGPITRTAVRRLQKDCRAKETGVVDGTVLNSLGFY